jgi:hypothetical protein
LPETPIRTTLDQLERLPVTSVSAPRGEDFRIRSRRKLLDGGPGGRKLTDGILMLSMIPAPKSWSGSGDRRTWMPPLCSQLGLPLSSVGCGQMTVIKNPAVHASAVRKSRNRSTNFVRIDEHVISSASDTHHNPAR